MKIEQVKQEILDQFARRWECRDFEEFRRKYELAYVFGFRDLILVADLYAQEVKDNLDEIYENSL